MKIGISPEKGDVLDLSGSSSWLTHQNISDVSTKFVVITVRAGDQGRDFPLVSVRAISPDKTKVVGNVLQFTTGSVAHERAKIVGKVNFTETIEISQDWQ